LGVALWSLKEAGTLPLATDRISTFVDDTGGFSFPPAHPTDLLFLFGNVVYYCLLFRVVSGGDALEKRTREHLSVPDHGQHCCQVSA